MKKTIVTNLIISTALFITQSAFVQANTGNDDVVIGYIADRNELSMEVIGPAKAIKGTNGHSYRALLEDSKAQVNWRVEGATSIYTKIDESGFLSIGVDEKAMELDVVACIGDYPTKYASMRVSLENKSYKITSIEKKPDLTMKYGANQEQLEEKLQEYNSFKVTLKTNDEKTYSLDIKRAKYYTDENVIDENGILKSGSFIVYYNLVLPNISINYDGIPLVKNNEETNILGDTSTNIRVNITKGEQDGKAINSNSNPKANTTIQGNISPNTGDHTTIVWYRLSIMMSFILSLYFFNKRKYHKAKKLIV